MHGCSMFCYVMCVIHVMGRKAICFGPEGRGLEGRICGWYFGGISLSFRAYSCGFMFQVLKSLWQGKGVIVSFLALMFYDMNLGKYSVK